MTNKKQWQPTLLGCDVCGFGTVKNVDEWCPYFPCPECKEVALPVSSPEGLLFAIYDLHDKDESDDALEMLYDWTDTIFTAGAFAECDKMMALVDVSRLNSETATGFLTSALAARDRLTEYNVLAKRVRKHLEQICGERTDRILEGLE